MRTFSARAVWFVDERTAALRTETVHAPASDQVQVRSICSLISAGSELNFYRGESNMSELTRFHAAAGQLPFPVKFGYQVVGVVEQTGDASGFAVGDRVYCRHPHQDRFVINAAFVVKVPDSMPDEAAAFMNLYRVALNSCVSTPMITGDCIAVSGLGIVGAFCAHIARRQASRLIVVEPRASRRQSAAWIKADAVVTPDDAPKTIGELTDGRGVDVFIEASGAPNALQLGIDSTAIEGTINVASWYGSRPVSVRLSPEYHLRRQKLISTGPSIDPALTPRWDFNRQCGVAFEHLNSIDVGMVFQPERIPFNEAPRGYSLLDAHTDDVPNCVLLQYPSGT